MTIIGKRFPAPTIIGSRVGPDNFPDLNFFSSGVFEAGQKVVSFGIGIPELPGEAPSADTSATISLYKVAGGDVNGAVRVWTKSFTIPQGHTGWFIQAVGLEDLVGVADGDVLCAAFIASPTTGNSFSIHHETYSDPVIAVVSAGYSTPPGTTPEVWEDWGLQNREPYFYVELEAPSGINELVPAAVDSIVGDVENPEVAGKKIEIAIDWARTASNDVPGYNVIRAAGEVVALLDVDGEPTGITHQVVAGVVNTTSVTAGSDFYGVPLSVWAAGWFTANGGTTVIELAGFAPGQSIVFEKMSGYVGGTNYRPTQVHINDIPIRLEPRLTADTPVDPAINVPVVADSEGKVAVSFSKTDDGQFYGYLNLAVFSYTTGAPSDDFVAEIAELVPAATDALQGSYADAASFTGIIAESLPPAVDAINATATAPVFAATIAELLPAAMDAITATTTAPVFDAVISETLPAAVDAITAEATAPEFAGAIAELVPPSFDAVTATHTAPGYAATITEFMPAAADAVTATSIGPVFAVAISEVQPPAVDAIVAINFGLGTSAFISETVPAAVDAITAEAAAPEWMGAIAELVPPSFDSVSATHVAPGYAGNIAELMPAATDAIVGTFAAPMFPGVIAEVVPAAIDKISARNGGFEILSANRTLRIPPENRVFSIPVRNRVFIVPPENRTFKIRR